MADVQSSGGGWEGGKAPIQKRGRPGFTVALSLTSYVTSHRYSAPYGTVPSFVKLYPSNTTPVECEKAFPVSKVGIRKLGISSLKEVDNQRESFSEVKSDYKRSLFECHFLWTFSLSLSLPSSLLARKDKLTVLSLAPVKLHYR